MYYILDVTQVLIAWKLHLPFKSDRFYQDVKLTLDVTPTVATLRVEYQQNQEERKKKVPKAGSKIRAFTQGVRTEMYYEASSAGGHLMNK